MRTIDHRRHAMRAKPGQDLNQAGVELARMVGEACGPYDLVITSTVPRAFQTAIAMGFAVDERLEALASIPSEGFKELGWPCDIGTAAAAYLGSGPAGTWARSQAELFRRIAARLPDGGRALVISHGGIVEGGAIALTPAADHDSWGPAIGYVEGLSVRLADGQPARVRPLRVPAEHYLVLN